ncbi:hypothetical protein [Vibrio metschnikovii]|uniref:hypothetical protein n=1 Tax=Vibrio metschnikovii TaxID=28172 RepID=UPI002FC6FA4C
MALCCIHHKALDRGVITFDGELTVQVSPATTGEAVVKRFIWVDERKKIDFRRDAFFIQNSCHLNETFERYLKRNIRLLFK